jgi:hypothetical protein
MRWTPRADMHVECAVGGGVGGRVAGVAGRDEVDLVGRIPRRRILAWGTADVWVDGVVRPRRQRLRRRILAWGIPDVWVDGAVRPRRRVLAWGAADVWVEGIARHRRRRTDALGFHGLAVGQDRRCQDRGTVGFAQALTQRKRILLYF